MSKPVRVRFAPSPTGPLHIGGVRTALFNYLFAKKHNGVFYLRIEDTDQNRFVPGAEEYIFEALDWLGIAPSETIGKNEKFGPYRQSERKELYKQYADQLINSGWAYYAFDTAEALDFHRKQHEEQGKTFIYNWHNREKLDTSLVISKEATEKRIANGEAYVIRFKTPVNETLHLHDIIRGEIHFETNLLDDKVLFKSDGMPTYHLANIVDDHLMETSHVIRGEEWLPSMPLHSLLYKAFGWEAPEFAHLPLILKPVGNGKLSKRDGDKLGFPVFPLEWTDASSMTKSMGYRENGFFPEAVINFLALLGWNDGTDQELFSLEELVEKFDLSRVHKSGAKFDPEKNKWFNHQYLKNFIRIEELVTSFIPLIENNVEYKIIRDEPKIFSSDNKTEIPNHTISFYKDCNYSVKNFGYVYKIVYYNREKATFISDFWNLCDFYFIAPKSYDIKTAAKVFKDDTKNILESFTKNIHNVDFGNTASIFDEVNKWLNLNNLTFGNVAQPIRLALVGELKGSDLYIIMQILGKEETIKRLDNAIASL
jgi:glutamyl-tRNA synthetase